MKNFLIGLLLILFPVFFGFSGEVLFQTAGKLSNKEGLAGAFIGTLNGGVYVMGGSNFEQGYPWEGGKKVYHDALYRLVPGKDTLSCTLISGRFPKPMAHGFTVSLPKRLFCFGGITPHGDNQAVYVVRERKPGLLQLDSVACFPVNFRAVGAVVIKNRIYLPGFIGKEAACYAFDPNELTWYPLAAYPGRLRKEGVMVCAQNCGKGDRLYMFGGRSVVEGRLFLHNDVLEYDPLRNVWMDKGPIRIKTDGKEMVPNAWMGAAVLAYGTSNILLFGGDDGLAFTERFVLEQQCAAETDSHKLQALQGTLKDRFLAHRGFSNQLLSYHTVTNTWVVLATAPQPLPVVTTAIKSGSDVLLIGGEAKPAIRTPDLLRVKMTTEVHFGTLNYTVVILYLLAMLGMGFYFMRRNKNTDRFFKGGGQIPWWAAGVSIFATALSAITFLSIPAKAFATDWSMLLFNLMIVAVAPIVVLYYLPFFRNLSVASAYEYLETRFSALVRYIASSFFILFMFARIAIVLYLPSLALNAVTGLDIHWCILMMGVVTLVYCTMGGIEAVVWGDFVQGIILVGGAILSLVWMIADTEGGLSGFVQIAVDHHKFDTFHMVFDWTQPVFWVVVVGGFSNQLLTYTSDQSVIQRYITTSDMKAAKKSIWMNAWLSIPVSFIFFLIGTALFTYYKTHPADIPVGMINADSIFPYFMMHKLPAGFAGLLIASVFAAAMSTLSSNINSISTAFTEDLIRPWSSSISERKKMVIARASGFVAGSLGIGIALWLASSDIYSLWDQFNLFLGFFTSGLGGLFLMGIFTRHINTGGALCGFFGSMFVVMALNHFTSVSFLLYGFCGLVSCFVIGYLCSFLFKK